MSSDEKPELKPANESPWYCLATLYGEQSGERDRDLAKRNRIAWNRWVAGALTEDERNALIGKSFPAAELVVLTQAEEMEFRRAFQSRAGSETAEPPKPDERGDFTSLRFDTIVDFSGFLFWSPVDFHSATFSGDANFVSATFSGNAYFGSATFSSSAHFITAKFRGRTGFVGAVFKSKVPDFRGGSLHEATEWDDA
ncbi:MAG: pentapeptide repeat-containing protein [Beijerinckiaceae bacterium]